MYITFFATKIRRSLKIDVNYDLFTNKEKWIVMIWTLTIVHVSNKLRIFNFFYEFITSALHLKDCIHIKEISKNTFILIFLLNDCLIFSFFIFHFTYYITLINMIPCSWGYRHSSSFCTGFYILHSIQFKKYQPKKHKFTCFASSHQHHHHHHWIKEENIKMKKGPCKHVNTVL